MEALSHELVRQLAAYNIDVKLATLTTGIGKYGRPLEAKQWNADFYLAVHSNAGGAGKANGAEAYYHSKAAISKVFAEAFVKRMAEVNPRKSTRSKQPAIFAADTMFSEVREPFGYKIPACLIEVDFHDNPTEAKWIIANKALIASAIIKAIVDTWEIRRLTDKPEKVPTPTPPKQPTEFKVKVIDPELNIRKKAGANQAIVGAIRDNGTYTIIETKVTSSGSRWGKLKSGAGWINISEKYVKEV